MVEQHYDLQHKPTWASSFRKNALRLHDLGANLGINILPWRDPDLPYFFQLSDISQARVAFALSSLLQAIEACDENISDTWGLTQIALDKQGYIWDSQLPTLVESVDYLAAYCRSQRMIFVSPNHFKIISYSIEDLYCRPWVTMFRRHTMIEQVLLKRAENVMQTTEPFTHMNTDIPPHPVIEVDSVAQKSLLCKSRLYSSICQNGITAGFISVNSGGRALPKNFSHTFQRRVLD